MDLAQVLPRSMHRPLAIWGKENWCQYEAVSLEDPRQTHLPMAQRGETLITMDIPGWNPTMKCPMEEWADTREFIDYQRHDRIRLTWFYMMSKVLANGPKVFTPNVEQCESMSEIDIDIPPGDFQQPYPTMVYEFPTAWARELASSLGLTNYPRFGIAHMDDSKFLILGIQLMSGDQIVVYMPPNYSSIEKAISRRMNNRSGNIIEVTELMMSHMAQRVMINAAMMLMQYPTKIAPVDQNAWDKHRRKAKTDPKFGLYALSDFQKITFQQNIVLREEAPIRNEGLGVQTGTHPKPHWRRGHWKMQTHGPQHSLRKRILIKPVFVRASAFTGDLSQTNVNIRKDK